MANEQPNEEHIFNLARRIPAADARSEYLRQVCGDNRQLRARIESLLTAHDQSGFMNDSPSKEHTIGHVITEVPGSMIGNYKVLQKIGEGGFGVVYMAEQQDPVRRTVAVKVIKPGMDTKEVVARFEAERQALAMMNHPNVAHVFDGGVTESGRPYFAMELVKGVPITEYCDKNKLSTEERLRLFIKVCQAVQHAHQKAIIHRDLKPSNVMVTLHDGKPVPKIIDFGVAKAINQRLTEKTMFTAYGQIIGTPQYMSPEQAEVSGLDVDTRSDVYALGVLLYELLTGSTPLETERLRTVGYAEMQRIIREEEPLKPSVRLSTAGEGLTVIAQHRRVDAKRLRQLLCGEIDWIVMKSLEKDRGRRYETASSLAADVERFLAGEPVAACPPSAWYRLRKMVQRHMAAILTATLILILLVGGIVVTGTLARRLQIVNFKLAEKNRLVQNERDRAEAGRDRAVVAEKQLRRRTFEYGINLGYEAWNRRNGNEFRNIMQRLATRVTQEEERGFEWRFLRARYQELSKGKPTEIPAQAVSMSCHPSGRYLAIALDDGSVMIQDCTTQEWMHVPDNTVGRHVAFSPQGNYLCVGGTGTEARDNAFPFQIRRFPSFDKVEWPDADSVDLSFVVLSPDESLLAGVRVDGVVEIRNVLTGRSVADCRGFTSRPVRLAFACRKRSLLVGGKKERLRLWNLNGTLLDDKSPPDNATEGLTFAQDGQTLVTSGWFGTKRWQVGDDGLHDMGWIIKGISAESVATARDGTLAVGCSDQTVRIWDLEHSREIDRLLHTDLVNLVAISPDGGTLFSSTRNNRVFRWEADVWRSKRASCVSHSVHPPLAASRNGRVAVAETKDEKDVLKLWDPRKGSERPLWVDPHAEILGVALSSDGAHLASASDDGTVRLGETSTGKMLACRQIHKADKRERGATCVAFSPDGTALVSGGSHGELYCWELDAWSKNWQTYTPRRLTAPNHVACVAFSSNGDLACGGGRDWNREGELIVWERNPAAKPKQIACPQTVRSLAYSPDGRLLAITYKFSGGVVRVLDARTLKKRSEFRSHSEKVTTLAFTTDGTRLVTGSDDGTVRFWDLQHESPVGTLQVGARVRNLALLPDGNTLLTLSLDGWLRQWRASPWPL